MQGNYNNIKRLEAGVNITIDLIKKCQRDDRKAVEQLYKICFKRLMPVCMHYHSNEEDARASFNIGFMKILKGIESLKEEINYYAFFKRIMVNALIDEYRKRKNFTDKVSTRETERELEFEQSSIENTAESGMGYDVLINLVKKLPEVSSRVFMLYVIDGYNHKEIGELLGISEGTSKWHLSTARKILREKIEEIESFQQKKMVI